MPPPSPAPPPRQFDTGCRAFKPESGSDQWLAISPRKTADYRVNNDIVIHSAEIRGALPREVWTA